MSGGGREAEIEAVAKQLDYLDGADEFHGKQDNRDKARTILAALDAVRSGSDCPRCEGTTKLREQIAWTVERCNDAMGDGFRGTPNSAVAAVCDALIALRSSGSAAHDCVRDHPYRSHLEAENERLRELYANQAGLAKRGWSIDHLMECEEALRMAEQRVAELEAESSSAAQNQEDDEFQYTEEKVTPEQARAAAHMARGGGVMRKRAARSFDDFEAYLCACKGEPYTQAEWEREVLRLERALLDARDRNARALKDGVCLPARSPQDEDHGEKT